MARFITLTADEMENWNTWVATRPKALQELARLFPPWNLYLYKPAGHRVVIVGYNDDGTVTILVSGKYNLVTMERRVHGVPTADLEECDLPDPTQPVGVMQDLVVDGLTEEDLDKAVRSGIRRVRLLKQRFEDN